MSAIADRIQSTLAGVSIRGWIALEVTTCFCVLCAVTKDAQMMKDVTLLCLGYYFGQKTPTPTKE